MLRKDFVEELKEVMFVIGEHINEKYSNDENFIWHEYSIFPVKYIRKAPKELGFNCLIFHFEIENRRSFSLEVHSKLLTSIYPLENPEKNWLNNKESKSFHFAMSWNRTVYDIIKNRNSKMYKKELKMLDGFFDFNLINYNEYDSIINYESNKKGTRDSLWAIADDMRARKEDGEFETYMDAYRWAEQNISKKGVTMTANRLQRAYHKAKSEGRIE